MLHLYKEEEEGGSYPYDPAHQHICVVIKIILMPAAAAFIALALLVS